MMSPSSSMDGRDMATDDIKLSRAASEYIERRAAFWLMEIEPELSPQELDDTTISLCLEELYREWVELARPAVETVNEKVGFDIRLRINVGRIRDDLAFLQGISAEYQDMAVDIHHIFPQAWCQKNDIDAEHRESIVNKTTLSARTNRVIGGVAPSQYLHKVRSESGLSDGAVDEILSLHEIDAKALRAVDFDSFFALRRERLCLLVERALGKSVQRDISEGKAIEDSRQFEESALEGES